MKKHNRTKKQLTGKARLRAEIVEMTEGLHRVGLVGDAELEMTTIRMLNKSALPKLGRMKPRDIVKVRKKAKISQAVLAASMNVAVNTVSQWERGERHPTGAALKLLNVIDSHGIGALM